MRSTVLVADDNAMVRKAACTLLGHTEDLADCIEAENGQEAVDKAIEKNPDLVILDYSMPVMDGLEAARRIHAALPDIPIVLFTMHGSLLKRKAMEDLGIAAMVSKSDAGTKLASTVRWLLSQRPGARAC